MVIPNTSCILNLCGRLFVYLFIYFDNCLIYCKGASEIILEECSSILKKDGESELKGKKRDEISDLIEEYASSGLRTIGLAYKEFSEEPDWEDDEEVIKDLVFLGLAGIKVCI